MESHLKEMKEITDKLASIGAEVVEQDQVVTLLGSLPPSYSALVTALEARVDCEPIPEQASQACIVSWKLGVKLPKAFVLPRLR